MAARYEAHRFYPKLLLTRALVGLPMLYPVIVLPLGPANLAGIMLFVLTHATDTLFQQLIDRDIARMRQAQEAERLARLRQRLREAHQAALDRATADANAQADSTASLPPEESPAN